MHLELHGFQSPNNFPIELDELEILLHSIECMRNQPRYIPKNKKKNNLEHQIGFEGVIMHSPLLGFYSHYESFHWHISPPHNSPDGIQILGLKCFNIREMSDIIF